MTSLTDVARRTVAVLAVAVVAMVAVMVAAPGSATAKPVTTQAEIRTFADKCFDLVGNSPADGARIVQNACRDQPNQRFTIREDGDMAQIRTSAGKCVALASPQVHAAVVQRTCTGDIDQLFGLEKLPEGRVVVRPFATHYRGCLDVAGGSPADGAPIVNGPCDRGDAQKLTFAV